VPQTTACSACGKRVYRGTGSRPEITCQECRRQSPEYQRRQQRQSAGPATCPICDKGFQQNRPDQRYCSKACRNRRPNGGRSEAARERERQRIRPPRICPVCDQQYHPTVHRQVTCSRICTGTLRRQQRGTFKWPASRIYLARCSICSRAFSSRRSRKTCGDECRRKQQSRAVSAWIKQRYHTDPAFRDQMLANSHARRASKLGLEGSKQVLLGYLVKRDKGRCGICHRPVRAKRGPMRPSIDHIIPLSRDGTHDLANVQLAHFRCNLEKHNAGGGEQLLLIG
jgi:hypothetical protein